MRTIDLRRGTIADRRANNQGGKDVAACSISGNSVHCSGPDKALVYGKSYHKRNNSCFDYCERRQEEHRKRG